MKKFVFAALAIAAIIWGGTGPEHCSSDQQLTDDGASGWSITESGWDPGWSITPAHARHVVSTGRDAALTPSSRRARAARGWAPLLGVSLSETAQPRALDKPRLGEDLQHPAVEQRLPELR